MSFRDTIVQLGFVMIALGASFATWALLTGPLGRYTKLGTRASAPRRPKPKREPEDDPRT